MMSTIFSSLNLNKKSFWHSSSADTINDIVSFDLQACKILHLDIRPANIVQGTSGFSIIDLGLGTREGQKPKSRADDLLYCCTANILKKAPSQISDAESLAYTLLSLAGRELPWYEAAISELDMEVKHLEPSNQFWNFYASTTVFEVSAALPTECIRLASKTKDDLE